MFRKINRRCLPLPAIFGQPSGVQPLTKDEPLWNSSLLWQSSRSPDSACVRSAFFPDFFWYTRQSIWQAKRTPGNLGVRVRITKGLAFWTLAMWRDNQAIREFVPASPHKEAMQKLPHWCDEAAFADWAQDTADWPSWETAREKLAATGRLVAVLHPSQRHRAGVIETF